MTRSGAWTDPGGTPYNPARRTRTRRSALDIDTYAAWAAHVARVEVLAASVATAAERGRPDGV